MKIEGITAVVTGGASGLGLATVRTLRARGAKVGILDIAKSGPKEFADDNLVHYVNASVTDEQQVIDGIAEIVETFGSLEVCVNCAGIIYNAPVVGDDGVHSLEAFRRVIDINLNGTFAVLSRAAEQMLHNDGHGSDKERGVIVNVASIRAFDGGPGGMAYAASKGAVAAMTLSLARDLAEQKIRANTIAPGIMNTEMFHNLTEEAIASHTQKVECPKRLGDPAEFADAVCFMIENRYMNGETMRIDAAMRV